MLKMPISNHVSLARNPSIGCANFLLMYDGYEGSSPHEAPVEVWRGNGRIRTDMS
jgi:hypothetical protein